MKSNLLQLITLSLALSFCATANADTSINEVFTCQLNEGKTMDDVRAGNSKWVKFMNANVEGLGAELERAACDPKQTCRIDT